MSTLEQQRALALARARQRAAQQKPERTGWDLPVQGMSGVNEGIAGLVGFPVDAVTGVINAGAQGVNALAGTDFKGIQNPIGGSESIRSLMAPTISEQQPQTAPERYARRIGQELGASAIPGLGMMGKAERPMALAGGLLGEAIGSGTAGQVTEDLGLPVPVQMAAEMAGGLAAPGAAYMARQLAPAPTLAARKQMADAGYDTVRRSGARVTPDARDYLVDAVRDRIKRERAHPLRHKPAVDQVDSMNDVLGPHPDIYSIEQERQSWGDLAGSREPGVSRLGMAGKEEIDSFLEQLSPGLVTGTNDPQKVVDALKDARKNQKIVYQASLLEGEDVGLLDKARRRAARSGTGGNEINALRQNISKILENPKLRRGYSEDHLNLMREIADGTGADNALRSVGRSLSPTTGALQGIANLMMTGQGIATGNPLWIAPAAVGYGAKGLGEARINKKIDQLAEMIRRGGPAPQKTMSDTERRLIAALLASQTAGAASPTQ